VWLKWEKREDEEKRKKRNPYPFLVGIYISAATAQISMEALQ
jgi:hypothetical protein